MTTPRDHRLAALPRTPALLVERRRVIFPSRDLGVVDVVTETACEFTRDVHMDGDTFRPCSLCQRPRERVALVERVFPPRVGDE
jgi:hypothetical protein